MKLKTFKLFEKLKDQKGATGADIIVALSIIVLTIGVISGIYINVSNNSKKINRTAGATRIATNIIENINSSDYESFVKLLDNDYTAFASADSGWTNNVSGNVQTLTISGKNIADATNHGKIFNTKIPKGYDVSLKITKIYDDDASKPKFDLVRRIDIYVSFNVNDKTEVVSLSTSKKREICTEVNTPDVSLFDSSLTVLPIKYSELMSGYVPTTFNDEDWYNYANKKWAMVYVGTVEEINNLKNNVSNVINITGNEGKIYYWIPNFSTDGEALYSTSKYPITKKAINNDDGTKQLNIYTFDSTVTKTSSIDENISGLWVSYSNIETNPKSSAFSTTKFGPLVRN